MREKADSDLVRRQNRLLLLEALRQPLEDGSVAVVRVARKVKYSPSWLRACECRTCTGCAGTLTPMLRWFTSLDAVGVLNCARRWTS